MNVCTIYGSTSPPGRLARAEGTFSDYIVAADGSNSLRKIVLTTSSPLGNDFGEAVGKSDLIALFSPVYKAGMPGLIKAAFDTLPMLALGGKCIGLIAMGGSYQHWAAVDTNLRQVATWFGAIVSPTTVYLTPNSFRGRLPTQETVDTLETYADFLLEFAHRLNGISVIPSPVGPNDQANQGTRK